MSPLRRGAFLDRDGTLIADAHYLRDANGVRLLPGAAEGVRRLNAAGVPVFVVTNQSGIARGLITAAEYEATRARLDALLAEAGAHLDGSYHCPHHPDVDGACDCRKPGTGLHRRAAAEHGVDLTRSLYLGDRHRDVAPGLALGGFARLVPSPDTPPDEREAAARLRVLAPSLDAAIEGFLAAVPS